MPFPTPTVANVLSKMAVTANGDDAEILSLVQQNQAASAQEKIAACRLLDPLRADYLEAFITLARGDLATAIQAIRAYQAHRQNDALALYNFGWLAENIFYLNDQRDIAEAALLSYTVAALHHKDFSPALAGMQRLYPFVPKPLRPRLWSGSAAIDMPRQAVADALEKAGAKARYLADFDRRGERWTNVLPLGWINDNLPHDVSILSVGCGAGFDLAWLHQKGFKNLHGVDKNPAAILAAQSIAAQILSPATFQVGNGLSPLRIDSSPICVLALNSLMFMGPDAYTRFIDIYNEKIPLGGYLIMDTLDGDTQTPSCRTRISERALFEKTNAAGLTLMILFREANVTPRSVYIFRRLKEKAK